MRVNSSLRFILLSFFAQLTCIRTLKTICLRLIFLPFSIALFSRLYMYIWGARRVYINFCRGDARSSFLGNCSFPRHLIACFICELAHDKFARCKTIHRGFVFNASSIMHREKLFCYKRTVIETFAKLFAPKNKSNYK